MMMMKRQRERRGEERKREEKRHHGRDLSSLIGNIRISTVREKERDEREVAIGNGKMERRDSLAKQIGIFLSFHNHAHNLFCLVLPRCLHQRPSKLGNLFFFLLFISFLSFLSFLSFCFLSCLFIGKGGRAEHEEKEGCHEQQFRQFHLSWEVLVGGECGNERKGKRESQKRKRKEKEKEKEKALYTFCFSFEKLLS
jgi:hypothetical protein